MTNRRTLLLVLEMTINLQFKSVTIRLTKAILVILIFDFQLAVRDNIERAITRIFYLPTDRMISDIGTKALSPAIFDLLSSYLLGHVTLPDFMTYIETHCPHLAFEPLTGWVWRYDLSSLISFIPKVL